jgi:cation:H+ antiporter
MYTSECDTRKSYILMIGATLLFIALAFRGQFDWISGVVLLLILLATLGDAVRDALLHRKAGKEAALEDLEDVEGADPEMPMWKILLFLALGLIGLPVGADLLVDSAVIIARMFHVSETVIGLTLVALGTSLPELATTVMAALRRQADVAIGNVIGSNMFNLLAVIGVASLIAPIHVEPEFLTFDLWVMLGASLLLIPFVFLGRDLGKRWGILLLGLYVGYIGMVLI